MISPIVQALNPFFQFITFIMLLPWTVLERVREIIRTTVSLNGYTGINPDGVLGEEKEVDDDEDESEGETKEEN